MKKIIIFLFATFSACGFLPAQETFPVNGIPDKRHITYAFTHAKIYIDYKTLLDSATLIIKDGIVIDAGKNISIPKEAVVTDLNGKYIYPSFIDLFSDYGIPELKTKPREGQGSQFLSNTKGAYGWNQAIRPEIDAYKYFIADDKKAEEMRNIGFGTVLSFNKDGIVRGSATVLSLADLKENELILKDRAASGFSFDKGSSSQDYPGSLMGCIALIRQTYYDAQWYKTNNKEYNISLNAFNKLSDLPVIFEVRDKLSALRANKIAFEFNTKYIIKGSGDEYQRAKELKATGSSFIIPVNFPEAYDVTDPYDAINVSLAELKHWEQAPFNAYYLYKENIPFAFTSAGLKDKKDFLKNIKKAIDCGLPEEEAIKALTYTAASLIKMEDKVGALKKGMMANFIITSKKIFDKDNTIYENWCKGNHYIVKQMEQKDIRGNYSFNINSKKYILKIKGEVEKPEATILDDSAKLTASFSGSSKQFAIQFERKKKDIKEVTRLNGFYDDAIQKLTGSGQLPDGAWFNWTANFDSAYVASAKTDSSKADSLKAIKPTASDVWFPDMAYGWKQLPVQKTILIRNATIWTCEKEGILKNADIVLKDGKILQTGVNIDATKFPGAEIVDGTGKHVSPGIIDEHSHIAISGDVNECTQSVTSEVRIGDVVDCDDINIYRQLSGGVTSAHLLHGSCNPVGGQTQLIKLRWGNSPEDLKFKNWDGFIKFALGENVKRGNSGDGSTDRYPQTRMGVEQTYVNAFTRAREYDNAWKKNNALSSKEKTNIVVLRRDLELDALAEILNKKRFITCHSYVQSEINMLMHVADTFGFRINTFTHILEGYKVADKMKKHGVGASSFADWWAYKFEVYEAIPYNGKILHDMGVTVAYNSDDAEMARRLNQEAAKAVKYGNVSEEEALKFVTLNPAKLLHVDDRAGSIKAGKDADIVLWSDNPLSIYARVLSTYVDGVKYFDSKDDQEKRDLMATERARIIQKMADAKSRGEKTKKISFTVQEEKNCMDEKNYPMNNN